MIFMDVETLLELALKWLAENPPEFPGDAPLFSPADAALLSSVRHFAGHGTEDMDVLPRVVWTVAGSGGPLVGDGIYECPLEVTVLAPPDRPEVIAALKSALISMLCEAALPTILPVLNAPASGADPRPVTGFGISALAMEEPGISEGRDAEKNIMGCRLSYRAWCHRE